VSAQLTLASTQIVSDDRTAESDRDRELVDRFRAGDRTAFDELVRRYQQQVYYVCLRYLKSDADAKDVSQRAFVRAYKALDKFRGESAFRTWLFRIAVNQSLNYIRDHKREQPREIRDDALTRNPTGPMRIIGDERSERLRSAIEELPPKQRMVLELRIYDELPFKEVAELADCSENAAKVNFHHAVKKLRAIMGDDQEGPE
jgi:RNA polymerase sigma-70 factor (ECF subfamily)